MSDDHLRPLDDPEPWQAKALCRGQGPELWFDPARVEEARTWCQRCPVQPQCADAGRDEYGVWGGVPSLNDLVCHHCGKGFPRPHYRGALPKMCSDECRYQAVRKAKREHMVRKRLEQHGGTTICHLCGQECWTRTQWGLHRLHIHGIDGKGVA